MKFYFFTKGDKTVPSSRYRAYYIADSLEAMGYETMVVPANDRTVGGFFKYLKILFAVTSKDVLYLQRTIYNKYFIFALLIAYICGKRYIFDIDDAVYEHSLLKTELLTRGANFVTCGSEKIREWTLLRNKQSYVLKNCIPLSVYTKRGNEPEGTPVIGWIGTAPEVYVKLVISALKVIAERGCNFNLKIIGAMGNPEIGKLLSDIPNVSIIDSLNWADPSEAVREIKSFTIGIMPLTNSDWDQMKYFKVLEYMACGVPVVASSGETVRMILEKFNCGFVATNTSEWVEKITLLLGDASLRAEMGTKGRGAVEEYYSVNVIAKDLLRYIRDNY